MTGTACAGKYGRWHGCHRKLAAARLGLATFERSSDINHRIEIKEHQAGGARANSVTWLPAFFRRIS
jgi:hypothetical protein